MGGRGGRSLPARGAWIEIVEYSVLSRLSTSLPARGAWIEIWDLCEDREPMRSLPARGAWIEAVVEAKILLLCQKLDNFHRKG